MLDFSLDRAFEFMDVIAYSGHWQTLISDLTVICSLLSGSSSTYTHYHY